TQQFHSQTENLSLKIVKIMGGKQQKRVVKVHKVVYAISLTPIDLLLSPDHDSRYGWVTHIYILPKFGGRILVAIKSLCDACMGYKIDIHEIAEETLYELFLHHYSQVAIRKASTNKLQRILSIVDFFDAVSHHFLLLADLACLCPELTCQGMIHILNFVGAHLFEHDDGFSARVVDKVCQRGFL
ncbi:hypothetical protein VP01_6572g1, partial [Puccinia sorghi]